MDSAGDFVVAWTGYYWARTAFGYGVLRQKRYNKSGRDAREASPGQHHTTEDQGSLTPGWPWIRPATSSSPGRAYGLGSQLLPRATEIYAQRDNSSRVVLGK